MLVASVGVKRVYQLCKMLTNARRPEEEEETRLKSYKREEDKNHSVLQFDFNMLQNDQSKRMADSVQAPCRISGVSA